MFLSFSKMHGLGNDFVVFDATNKALELSPEQVRFIADRRLGVGCDQVLLVERAQDPLTDFYYRIYNADGSEVEQCGNGARCFARFVRHQGLTGKDVLDVGTRAGRIRLFLEEQGGVRVNMGAPRLEPEQIPFLAEGRVARYPIEVDGDVLMVSAVSMGNPHAVLWVASAAEAPVAALGPKIEYHARFPERVNVGFMEIQDREHIRLRVHERGAGETPACGTGACAAVVAGQLQGLLDEQVSVSLAGGDLVIKWQGENEPVWMSGPAAHVYEGRIEL